MDTFIPFVAALSNVTTFGDAVETCKLGGEGTAKLTVKLGRAPFVPDTGNLPPGPGAMGLAFLTEKLIKGLAWEAEGV